MTHVDASEDNTIEFLDSLRNVSIKRAETLIENIEIEQLTLHLKTVEIMLRKNSYENDEMHSDEMIPLNFLYILTSLLKWNRSSNFDLLSYAHQILTALCLHPKQRKLLIITGFGKVLGEILSKDNEREVSSQGGHPINSADLIFHFFPALPPSDCYEDKYFLSTNDLLSGHTLDNDTNESRKDFISMLNAIFRPVYELCQRANSPQNYFVLLKLIYWANAFDVLTKLVDFNKLIDFIKKLLQSDKYSKFGLALVHTLISKYLQLFRREKIHEMLDNTYSGADPISNNWVAKIHQILAARDDPMVKMFLYCVKDESFSSTIHLQAELVRAMLEFLLP